MADQLIDLVDQRTDVTDQRTDVTDQRTVVTDQRTDVTDQRTVVTDQRTNVMDQRTDDVLNTLTSMFPDVEPEICEAVLNANNGELEASVNSLLGMSDPNFNGEETIPVQTESGIVTSSSRQQIERDEELARYLAAEADRELGPPPSHLTEEQQREYQQQQQQQQQQSSGFPDFSEELPIIKEKIIQAADTTKKKVKEWYEKFRQQSSPKNENQYSNPQYTNLPKDEADNPMLGEDFSESMNLHKNN
ncbi:CUE domain-containing protein 5 [Gigaspora margarita]|uniref:CUE domain-containing protein 5 n=1 Tax=Gigaspora margarita TaxID=4874 RepID=A0A8H4AH96_GIGMA|nr:CUE domain-containing protein 5 [Gigaspora margarita]